MEHFSSEKNPLRKDFRSTGTAIEPPGFSTPAGVLYYHKPIRHGWHSLSVSFPGVPHFLTVRTHHLSEKSAWSLEIRSYRSPAISFTSGAVRCGNVCAMPQRNLGAAMANTTDKPWLMSEAAQSCTGRTDSPYQTLVCGSTDVFSRRPLYLAFRTCRIWRYLRGLLQKVLFEEGTYWFWTPSSRLLITRVP